MFFFQIIIPGFPDPLATRKIINFGVGAQSLQEPKGIWVLRLAAMGVVRVDELVNSMVRVVEIAKCDGTGRTGLGARGLVLFLFQLFPLLVVGQFHGPLIAVKTEAALFHNAAHAYGNIRVKGLFHPGRPDRIPPVKNTGMIGAGGHAITAAKAARVDLADNTSEIVIVRCGSRADRYTG